MATQIDIDPAELNFSIHKGATLGPLVFFCRDADCNPTDLTGSSAYAEVRADAQSPVIFDLAPTVTDAAAGEITIERTDEQTAAISASSGEYAWDLLYQNSSGKRFKIARGTVDLTDTITQPA